MSGTGEKKSLLGGIASGVGSLTKGVTGGVGSLTSGVTSGVGSLTSGVTGAVGGIANKAGGMGSAVGSVVPGASLDSLEEGVALLQKNAAEKMALMKKKETEFREKVYDIMENHVLLNQFFLLMI